MELVEFTRDALARGIDRDRVAATLATAGWNSHDVASALSAFAEVGFPLPVPRPKPRASPREVLTYLVLFTALYDSVFNLCRLAFELVNRAFPDPLQHVLPMFSDNAIRWSVASLFVAFPVFLALFQWVNAGLARDPARRGSRPRRWLTSLTLFIVAVAMAGDAITLIYELLSGELTRRIALKVATVAIIAGGSFTYFLVDLRREETT